MHNGTSDEARRDLQQGLYKIYQETHALPPDIDREESEPYSTVWGTRKREFSGDKPNIYGPGRNNGVLVERPAATMAMNASMMQPSKVIRVLARGEKLDP